MDLKIQSNRVFRPVHLSRCRYVAMKGSAGSGKSTDTAQQYLLRLMQDKGRNLLCVRKSDVTNRDSTYAELLSAINRIGAQPYWTSTLSPLKLTCKNGNSIIFRGVNDEKQREKIKSITFEHGKLTDVWIEEATEITQNDFEIIDDRLRGKLPEGQFYQIKMTFNPVSKQHWIKRHFFDYRDTDTLINHSTYLDNRFIDEAYKKRMERRKRVDPDGYRIYGLGEWGEVGGLILINWVAEEFDRSPSAFDLMVNAQDFGFNHANCIGEVGFKDGELFLCRESYEFGKDTSELIKIANDKGFRKNLRMYCDSAEPDRIKTWRRAGYDAVPVKKYSGSVAAQIDVLKGMRIHIHPNCTNTLKEISQWKYRKDDQTGLYTEEPVPFMDDAMAMLRYAVEPFRRPKPKAVNINDQIAAIRRLGL